MVVRPAHAPMGGLPHRSANRRHRQFLVASQLCAPPGQARWQRRPSLPSTAAPARYVTVRRLACHHVFSIVNWTPKGPVLYAEKMPSLQISNVGQALLPVFSSVRWRSVAQAAMPQGLPRRVGGGSPNISRSVPSATPSCRSGVGKRRSVAEPLGQHSEAGASLRTRS